MAQQPISASTLGSLDNGAAGKIIDAAFREAIGDIDDRGEDLKPRKVTITVTMQAMKNGLIETVVDAKPTIPARKTAGTIARKVRKMGRLGMESSLEFQEYAPEDPHQRTMDDSNTR